MNMNNLISGLWNDLDSEVYSKLMEAEQEAKSTDKRYSSADVLTAMQETIR